MRYELREQQKPLSQHVGKTKNERKRFIRIKDTCNFIEKPYPPHGTYGISPEGFPSFWNHHAGIPAVQLLQFSQLCAYKS